MALSKIGAIRLHTDRPLEGTPKTCTIVRKADGWYAHMACDAAPSPLPPTGKVGGIDVGLGAFATGHALRWRRVTRPGGIDVGLEAFATLSNGERIANPRFYRVAERKLKQAQRRLARRVKGSHRYRKARTLLASSLKGQADATGRRLQACSRAGQCV